MQFLRFRVIIKRLKAVKFMLKDKSVKWYKKALVAAGIIYIFIPVGIPIVLPFAIPADIIIWLLILWLLKDELDKYWMGDKAVDLSRRFHGKRVINDVDYTVEEKGGKNGGK